MIPTLRTLTKKSSLHFGSYKNLTIGRMLELGKKLELINVYYKITSINYNDDILAELGIVGEWTIKKPGKNIDKYYAFLKANNYKKKVRNRDGANALKKEAPNASKSVLRSYNQKKR